MIRKITLGILVFALLFSVSVSAETQTPAAEAEAPVQQEQRQGRGPGGMGGRPADGTMPEGMAPPERPEGMQGGMVPPEMPEGGMPEMQGNENAADVPQNGEAAESGNPAEGGEAENAVPAFGDSGDGQGGFLRDMMDEGQNQETASSQNQGGVLGFLKAYATPLISVVLLGIAFVFVMFYKRKRY